MPQWKRRLDVSLILLSSLAWAPLMFLIACWIKLVSRGPLLYRQTRVGWFGREFVILKFRTMRVNADTATHERHFEDLMTSGKPMIKLDNRGDPRIFFGGKLLRVFGLDELPQLFNVLRGDMSLVGPRPCTVNEFERYEPWQKARVNAPPGLTGYWQVNGKNRTTFLEMINMDLHYVRHMSLLFDTAIMIRTIPALLGQALATRSSDEKSTPARFSGIESHR